MDRPPGRIRIKVFTLVSLLLLTLYFGTSPRAATACWECVVLTGGLCVGCDPNVNRGHKTCVPDQNTCTCTVGGSCSEIN